MSRYRWFVVTSQYRIEDIFVDKDGNPDHATIEALRRRFKVVHFDVPFQQWRED